MRLFNNRRFRAILYQVLVIAGTVAVGFYLVSNTLDNLAQRGIATGLTFLGREAGFDISESLVDYSAADTYGEALVVGLLNTLKVSLIGIVLASLIGTVIGIARLSSNWLLARLATVYVEGVRNIPLLLQLFVWYGVITALPSPRQALAPMPGVFLTNRGLRIPSIDWNPAYWVVLAALFAGLVGAFLMARWGRRRHEATGRPFPAVLAGTGLTLGLTLAAFVLIGAPLALEVPELSGFNFQGGLVLSPEFAAVLAGLTIYTAGFIAEIVRSGILAVARGQTEAALSLGLTRLQVLRLVVLPQALRVIVPPMTSQYLNLTKNSSLAVAIGYPDLISVANTAINQTGQAVEGVAIAMAAYLTISLAISAFMNWYNRKVALVSR
ncbi:MAG: amino acid ABC transporter permease [Alphaproteobacteria bacterium]|nr:amino acid ABC transporter permease [Alphaproteobacteria bacterium]